MASRNDEAGGFLGLLIIAGVILVMLAMVIAAVASFVSVVLTLVFLFAWNRPRRLGPYVIMPEEARAFVGCGLLGAILLPAFCAFCDFVFDVSINWSFWPYFLLFGYVGGSLAAWKAMGQIRTPRTLVDIEPVSSIPELEYRPTLSLPPPEPKPFRYASWDDEEILR